MIISGSGILLIDKEAMIDFTAILSLLVNLPTFLSCHFVKIKITFVRSVHIASSASAPVARSTARITGVTKTLPILQFAFIMLIASSIFVSGKTSKTT